MPTSARGLYLIVPHPKVECVQNKLSLKQSRCLWFPRSTQTIHHQLARALLEYSKSGCGDDSSASGVAADTSVRFYRRQDNRHQTSTTRAAPTSPATANGPGADIQQHRLWQQATSQTYWLRPSIAGWAKPPGRAKRVPDDRLRVPTIRDNDS